MKRVVDFFPIYGFHCDSHLILEGVEGESESSNYDRFRPR